MVVITSSEEGPFGDLAASIAAERGERLVTNVNRIPPGEPLVYVDAPTALSAATIQHLQTLGMEHPPYRFTCSIITGRTVEEARALYNRRSEAKPASGTHQLAIRDLRKQVSLDDPVGDVFAHDEVTTDGLERANSSGMASLSAVLHGTTMYSRLEDGLLVGAPSDPAPFEFTSPQPPFVSDDGSELDVDQQALRADQLDVSQVFLNGCSSIMANVNDGKDTPIHVVHSLLDSARTLIGTYRITECIPHHGALHYALLRAGYTPAERAYILNKSAVTSGIDYYPYIIAGDPTVEPADTLASTYDVELSGSGRCELRVTDVDTPVIDTRIPADRFPSDATEFFVRRRADSGVPGNPDDCYYTAFREGDDVRVLIWGWGPITVDQLRVTIGPSRTDESLPDGFEPLNEWTGADLTTVPPSVTEAESIQWAGPLGKEARKRLRESRAALRDANARLAAERFDADAFRETIDSYLRAGEHLRNARRQVLDKVLADRSATSLQATYIDHVDTGTPAIADRDCPYCSGPVFLRPTRDAFGELARELGICPNCSYAFDVSTQLEDTVPELHGQFYGPDGDSVPVTVVCRNPLDRPTDAVVTLGISHEAISTPDVVDESERVITLAPGEQRRLTFEFDRARLMEMVTPDDGLADVNRRVTVEPDWSYFGPAFRGNDARVIEALERQGALDPSIFDGDEVTVEVDGESFTVPRDTFEVSIEESEAAGNSADYSRPTIDLDGQYVVEAHVVLQNLEILSGMRTLYLRPD